MEKSLQTKVALASAFEEILETVPFQKITISQIADQAGMSRKSFYYHFEDKYDLVKWIFEYEFAQPMEKMQLNGYPCIEQLCYYLYSKGAYYRRVLFITEQNSLSEYLHTYMQQQILTESCGDDNGVMKSVFMSDAILVMIKRWLRDIKDMNAHQFVHQLFDVFHPENSRQTVAAAPMLPQYKYAAV